MGKVDHQRENVNEKNISFDFKGQLISECLFDVLNFPKKQRKI